jgi:hypothetical protein
MSNFIIFDCGPEYENLVCDRHLLKLSLWGDILLESHTPGEIITLPASLEPRAMKWVFSCFLPQLCHIKSVNVQGAIGDGTIYDCVNSTAHGLLKITEGLDLHSLCNVWSSACFLGIAPLQKLCALSIAQRTRNINPIKLRSMFKISENRCLSHTQVALHNLRYKPLFNIIKSIKFTKKKQSD